MELEMLKLSTSPMRSLLAYALPAPVTMLMSELDRLLFAVSNGIRKLLCALHFMLMKPKAKHVILNQLALMCNLTE